MHSLRRFLPLEIRLAQAVVVLAGCVPVLAGGAGVLLGTGKAGVDGAVALDSHYRYLSGLLLGIGLTFWCSVPARPVQGDRFKLLTVIVVLGGLGRLLALPLLGWSGPLMFAALTMELVVTPLLCLLQARIARLYGTAPSCR